MAKHSREYHIKQLDKIAKTGIVPDEYKNVFRGVKNPQAQIKKAISDINKIDRGIHETHIKNGIEDDDLCFICNPSGKKRRKSKKKVKVEEIVKEEIIESEVEVKNKEEIVEIKKKRKYTKKEKKVEEVVEEDDWEKGW